MAKQQPIEPKAKQSKTLFEGILGVVEGYSRRTLIIIVLSNVLLACGVIGGVWYYNHTHHKKSAITNSEDGNLRRVNRLNSQGAPKAAYDQVIYYSQLAENYSSLKQYDQALKNYQLAQSAIEKGKLGDTFDFLRAIGDTYLAQGNKAKAKEYYNKEIDRLKAYIEQHPDNPGNNQDVINDLQAQVQKL